MQGFMQVQSRAERECLIACVTYKAMEFASTSPKVGFTPNLWVKIKLKLKTLRYYRQDKELLHIVQIKHRKFVHGCYLGNLRKLLA